MDTVTSFDAAIFIVGIILSAFFSGSEAILLSISVKRMKQLMEEGGKRGKAIEYLLKKPSEMLTTILVGNNFINIFVASYATKIAEGVFGNQALAYSVGITTILILFFGEVIPKTFMRNYAEKLAPFVISVLRVTYLIPPVWLFVKVFMIVLKIVLGKNSSLVERIVTKDDIEFMVAEAEKDKSIDKKQIHLLNSILEFSSIKVKDIMVPRSKVHAIKKDAKFDEIITLVKEVAHSRYPVYEEDMDKALGFLHVKDLAFVSREESVNFEVTKFIKSPFFVYEHMKIQAVFDHMNKKKVHLALVKNEMGTVVGIITLEDIMEEIFGDINDEHDDEDDVKQGHVVMDKDQEFIIVDATTSLRDINADYDLKIPIEEHYSTLAGFLLDKLGNSFPKQDNIILWENYRFILEKVVDKEIVDVKIEAIDSQKGVIKERDDEDDSLSEDDMQNADNHHRNNAPSGTERSKISAKNTEIHAVK